MAFDPHLLAFDLHRKLLRCLSNEVHFASLPVAGGHHLRACIISKTSYRRLCNLDITYNVMRHITQAFVANMITEAEEYMSKVDTKTVVGAEPGQRKADLHVLPTGVHFLGFDWHTKPATQTEAILPMEVPFTQMDSSPSSILLCFGPNPKGHLPRETQLAQPFLGPTYALTGAEPGPGPQTGHCKAEATQLVGAKNVTHKDKQVPNGIQTASTPSVASPLGALALGGPSRLESYMMDLGAPCGLGRPAGRGNGLPWRRPQTLAPLCCTQTTCSRRPPQTPKSS